MAFVVHLFLGTVTAGPKKADKFTLGNRHAFLLYLRADKNSDYDEGKAKEIIEDHGWLNVTFSKAGTADPNSVKKPDQKFYCADALEKGSALVIYDEPVTVADPFRSH